MIPFVRIGVSSLPESMLDVRLGLSYFRVFQGVIVPHWLCNTLLNAHGELKIDPDIVN